MSEKSMKFEASMERLEAIVRQLEQGNAPLDESLKLFHLVARGGQLVEVAGRSLLHRRKAHLGRRADH